MDSYPLDHQGSPVLGILNFDLVILNFEFPSEFPDLVMCGMLLSCDAGAAFGHMGIPSIRILSHSFQVSDPLVQT